LLAIENWRHYLQPAQFIIKTDHFILKFLKDQRMNNSLQHKGLTKLLSLSYEIQYKKRVENIAADALSHRFKKETGSKSMSVVQPLCVQEVVSRYEEDIEISKLLSQLLLDGILRYKEKIWVGSSGNLRQQLVEAMDITTWGGYSGVYATQQRLKSLALSS